MAFDDLIGNDFGSGSEDCLHMNIYVPKDALFAHRQLPVYVYFHGGAFLLGSNSDIDGTKIAREQDIIIVIANYRLGVFGFWFSDQILHSENPLDSGNQGLMDQQCALQWVNNYIYYFGGGSNRITIGGMSAGAQSIQNHLTMKSSQPLYQRAISHSGPTGVPLKNVDESLQFYRDVASYTDCCFGQSVIFKRKCHIFNQTSVDCLRSKTPAEIQRAAYKILNIVPDFTKITQLIEPFAPTIGSALVPRSSFDVFVSGDLVEKPIIFEVSDNEGYKFIEMMFRNVLNKGNQVKPNMWRKFVAAIFGQDSYEEIIKHYDCPCDDKNDPACECWDVADQLLTDFTWYCNQRRFLAPYTKSKRPIYSLLKYSIKINVLVNSHIQSSSKKAIHGVGQFFFFGNRYNLSGADELWARAYQNYLANFIRTGNPNDWSGNPNDDDLTRKNYPGKVKVPKWNGNWFKLGPSGRNGQQGKDKRKKKCDMFDKLDEYMLH